MALLTRIDRRLLLQPSTEVEQALLGQAAPSGRLLLDEAYYPVSGAALVLPPDLSEARALHLLGLFERAALAHARAEARRRSFTLVR